MDEKITDNEIKKALECCAKNNGCDDCPLYAKESCFVVEGKALLDLLNRKDAEIERLKSDLEYYQKSCHNLCKELEAEKIKNF